MRGLATTAKRSSSDPCHSPARAQAEGRTQLGVLFQSLPLSDFPLHLSRFADHVLLHVLHSTPMPTTNPRELALSPWTSSFAACAARSLSRRLCSSCRVLCLVARQDLTARKPLGLTTKRRQRPWTAARSHSTDSTWQERLPSTVAIIEKLARRSDSSKAVRRPTLATTMKLNLALRESPSHLHRQSLKGAGRGENDAETVKVDSRGSASRCDLLVSCSRGSNARRSLMSTLRWPCQSTATSKGGSSASRPDSLRFAGLPRLAYQPLAAC